MTLSSTCETVSVYGRIRVYGTGIYGSMPYTYGGCCGGSRYGHRTGGLPPVAAIQSHTHQKWRMPKQWSWPNRPPYLEIPPDTPAPSITDSVMEEVVQKITENMDRAGVNLCIFLRALGSFATQRNSPISVFPDRVMFADDNSKRFLTDKWRKDLSHFVVLSKWVRLPRGRNEFLLALFLTWTSNPIARKTAGNAVDDAPKDDDFEGADSEGDDLKDKKSKMELHAVVVVTIYLAHHGGRKVFAVCEPNVISVDNRYDSLSAIARKAHLVKLFLHYEKTNARAPYFINKPRPEHNSHSH
ncbi:hypothetical protein B0H13DRAFT_2520147 [Mycena leptocephala]|nr:hypothetical protein B0H13DRAFT_2520147 [Mycena leptocephala]